MPCHDYVMDGATHSLPMKKFQVEVIGGLGENKRCGDSDKGGPVPSLEITARGSPDFLRWK